MSTGWSRVGNDDGPGFGKFLQARGDIDPVAVNVLFFERDIANVQANTQLNEVMAGKRFLQPDGTSHAIRDAGELHQPAIPHALDQPAAMLNNGGSEDLPTQLAQRRKRAGLVFAHEPRIADDIRRHNRGQSALRPV